MQLIGLVPFKDKKQISFHGNTASLNLLVELEYNVSSHFSVRATANYQRISDGGELKFKEPPTENDRILKIRNGTFFNFGAVLNL